jgi:Uma2 family endonuclease
MSDAAVSMSWEEYQALGDDVRGEYIDGTLVVTPPPSRVHQRATVRLAVLLEQACAGRAEVDVQCGWKPEGDEFAPDVMVVPPNNEVARFTGTPHLVVEILSSNRSHDLVRKSTKYALLGVPRYWILDSRDEALIAFELRAGAFEQVARLVGNASAPLGFGVGTVVLSPAALLR